MENTFIQNMVDTVVPWPLRQDVRIIYEATRVVLLATNGRDMLPVYAALVPNQDMKRRYAMKHVKELNQVELTFKENGNGGCHE